MRPSRRALAVLGAVLLCAAVPTILSAQIMPEILDLPGPADSSATGPEEGAVRPDGEEPPPVLSEEFELDEAEVVYSAARKMQMRHDAPAAVHVITAREIRALGGQSLADVLRRIPGVEVRSWMSGYDNVTIHGLLGSEVANTRILWLEDGISINDVRDGGFWLDETFPLELIERIEVILGPGSALYGTNAFLGVVNLDIKDAASLPPSGEYRLSYGSFGRRTASATFGRRHEELSLLVHASLGQTEGPGLIAEELAERSALRQTYARGLSCSAATREAEQVCAGQGEEDEPCRSARTAARAACSEEACARATAAAQGACHQEDEACRQARLDAAAACSEPVPAGEVSSRRRWVNLRLRSRLDPLALDLAFRQVEASFDGALYFPNQFYLFGHQEVSGNASMKRKVHPRLELELVGSWHRYENLFRNYSDYRREEFLPGAPLAGPEILGKFPEGFADKIDYDIVQDKLTVTAQAQYAFFPPAAWGGNELIAGVGFRHEAIRSPEMMPGRQEQAFDNGSAYLQDELRLLGNRLLLTLGGRVDTHNDYDAVVSYRGAVLLKPVSRLRLRVSAGTAFKEPAMWQLYVDHIDAQGNPGLKPERLTHLEGGLSWQAFEPLELRLDGFVTWLKDLIDNQFLPELAIPELHALGHSHYGKFHPTQTGSTTRLRGGEASLRFRLGEGWDAGLSYALLQAEDAQGRELPYDTPHKASLFFIRQGEHGRAGLEAHWVGSTVDRGGEQPVEVPQYWLFQVRSQTDLVGGLALGVSAGFVVSEGLGDTERHVVYEEMASVPLPRYVLSSDLSYPF